MNRALWLGGKHRLARWLLMMRDRSDDDAMAVRAKLPSA